MMEKTRKEYAPMILRIVGKQSPTRKLPPQLASEPHAIAAGRGPTSNISNNKVQNNYL